MRNIEYPVLVRERSKHAMPLGGEGVPKFQVHPETKYNKDSLLLLGRCRAEQKYRFLGFATRAPGTAGGHPRPSLGVSGASGTLPEKPGTHHEPNPKTYEPKRID